MVILNNDFKKEDNQAVEFHNRLSFGYFHRMISILTGIFSVVNIIAIGIAVFFIFKLFIMKDGNPFINQLAVALLISNILLISGYTAFYFYEYKLLPFFQLIAVPVALSSGPLVYLYCKAIAKGQKRIRDRNLIHFLPAFLMTCIIIFNIGSEGKGLLEQHKYDTYKFKDNVAVFMYVAFYHWLFYFSLSVGQIFVFKKYLKTDRHEHNRLILKYMYIVVTAFLIISLVSVYCFAFHFSAKMVLLIATVVAAGIIGFLYFAKKYPHVFWNYDFLVHHNKNNKTNRLYY